MDATSRPRGTHAGRDRCSRLGLAEEAAAEFRDAGVLDAFERAGGDLSRLDDDERRAVFEAMSGDDRS